MRPYSCSTENQVVLVDKDINLLGEKLARKHEQKKRRNEI